jgi:hypothetical protein
LSSADLFPILDASLNEASDRYLSMVELVTTSADHMTPWRFAISQCARDGSSSASPFPRGFIEDSLLSERMLQFVSSGQEASEAIESLLQPEIPAIA